MQGVTFTEVQKPTAAAAGDSSSALNGAQLFAAAARWCCQQLGHNSSLGPACASPCACFSRRGAPCRAVRRARVADAHARRAAAALGLTFLVIGSLESVRLVNDRAEKGLDTYLNKKSRAR